MHKYVFHNDRIVALNQVRLSPGQAGLLNGWGAFTTFRIYAGRPFAFERHWKRLTTDAGRIQLPMPFEPQAVRQHLDELLAANRVSDGCVRLYFIYNNIGLWASDEDLPITDLLMTSGDRPKRAGPTDLTLRPHGRHAAHPLSNVKVISWLHNVWTVEQAHKQGFEEALLLNERNEVAECTAANVFSVRGGAVTTPPLDSGCLPGVSREVLLELGPRNGLPIREATLTMDDLGAADEIFITSTTREVQPIRRIDDLRMPQAPGPVTERLASLFSEYVATYIGKN